MGMLIFRCERRYTYLTAKNVIYGRKKVYHEGRIIRSYRLSYVFVFVYDQGVKHDAFFFWTYILGSAERDNVLRVSKGEVLWI